MSGVVSVAVRRRVGAFELDVSFVTEAGVTAIFGRSGAGKTLTLRAVAGLDRPDAGRVSVGDQVWFDAAGGVDLPTRARAVGYVFQQYALFPHLDVFANVAYGLAALAADERRDRALAALRMVGLEDRATALPAELSGGQQQRVALARAVAPRPRLLLLDEPFAAVDAIARGGLRRELRAVRERTGVPVLLVTHDLAEVRALADQLVIVAGGRVVQSGATEVVLAAPAPGPAAELLAAASEG